MERVILAIIFLAFAACVSTEPSKQKMYLGTKLYGCGPTDEPTLEYEIKISPKETARFDSERDNKNKVSVFLCPIELGKCQEGEGEYKYISDDLIQIDIEIKEKRFRGSVHLIDGPGAECG